MTKLKRNLATLSLFGTLAAIPAPAQTLPRKPVPARITAPIDENRRTLLARSAHPLARPEFDRGAAPASLPVNRITLVLKRTPEQQSELNQLLADQVKPGTAQYRHWLTPDEFGARFGVSDRDIERVSGWLASHGFQVAGAARGKGSIEFSGTAAQLRSAFRVEMHRYFVRGKEHWANSGPPSIPSALDPVVKGIANLSDFYSKSNVLRVPKYNTSTGAHAMGPGDFATIYNLNPLYQAGLNGTGATIGIVARTDINLQDVADFRMQFGLPANPPVVVTAGEDPGISPGDDVESMLDVSWSGGIAPGATVKLFTSASSLGADGVDMSEAYIVDNNAADIISESYGRCEADISIGFADYLDMIRQQAAAQGITFIVSAGDSGPFSCDGTDQLTVFDPNNISISAEASSAYVTAVGGTQFNEGTNAAAYWAPTNSATLSSALSYIPELPWDESCGDPFCFNNIIAGGGGASLNIGKPDWQNGVAGIPNDNSRDIPDISFTASSHDPYAICFDASCFQKKCPPCFVLVSGTSASAPSFAGIVAILKQKAGTRLGNINPGIYALAAAEDYSQCNSDGGAPPASTCVFNDITTGNNGVNGETGFGTDQAFYAATVGYDLATGLGSLNGANFVNSWKSPGVAPTTTTLSVSPATLVHGSQATITIQVSGTSGTPTGPVDLNAGKNASVDVFPLQSGSVNATEQSLPGGVNQITAVYGGDSTFAPSASAPVAVTVTPEPSIVTVSPVSACGRCAFNGGPYGTPVALGVFVNGASGFGNATGTVTFTDNGASLSGAPVLLDPFGIAAAPAISGLTVGTHSIVATYSGDPSFSAGTSAPYVFSISKAPTSITLTPASACAAPNSPVALNLQLNSPSFGGISPTGALTVVTSTPQAAGTLDSTGAATVTLPSLPAGVNEVVVVYPGDANFLPSTATTVVNVTSGGCIGSVTNAADYVTALAPGSLISIFGTQLAASPATPTGALLPLTLGGVSVNFTDSTGFTAPANLSYVGPTQINGVVPTSLFFGNGVVEVTTAQGTTQATVNIQPISPSLFSADGSGKGIAAANLVRVTSAGVTTYEPVVNVDSSGNITARPIVFNSGDQLALALYGTGMENLTYGVGAILANREVIPQYVGPSSYEGLDQVNIDLPPSLAGSGPVDIFVFFDDQNFVTTFSNTVTVTFQ